MASNEKYMPDRKYVIADELITEKLEQIQNYEQTDRDGRTLLINAAFYNRINAIKYLLKKMLIFMQKIIKVLLHYMLLFKKKI